MMTLGLIFCLLLVQSCHGQDDTSDTATNSTTPASNNTPSQETNTLNEETNTLNQEANNTTQHNDTSNQQTDTTNQPIPVATEKSTQEPIQKDTLTPTAVHAKIEPTSGTVTPSLNTMRTTTEVYKSDNEIFEDSNQSSNLNQGKSNDKSNEKSPAVFVSVLLAGLLLAALIIGGFCYKSHCKTNNKGMKLAEESYMADEENQGNTLVSVAPLNQPEPQEKTSLNGESPEGVKTPTTPAATNGHSTTKTADTEL